MPTKKEKANVKPLYYDLQAKNLFGTSRNKKFTQDLLEKYFGYQKGELNGCKISNSIRLNSETLNGKNIELDIKVKLKDGSLINLEFYSLYDKASEIKSFFYVSKIVGSQLNRGETYEKIRKVKQLNFIYDDNVRKDDALIKRYAVINREDPFDYIMENSFQIDIINLAKDNKKVYNEVNEGLAKWILFIGAQNYEEMEKYAKGEVILEEALEEMTRFSNNERFSGFTLERFYQTRINITSQEAMEKGKQEGIEIGKEEGIKIGEEKGIKIGEEKGMKIGEEKGIKIGEEKGMKIGKEECKFEIAKNLLHLNILPIDDITKVTGLTKKEVNSLKISE